MRIQWEIEDGYVGKSRPHYVEVPDDELDGFDEEYQIERELKKFANKTFWFPCYGHHNTDKYDKIRCLFACLFSNLTWEEFKEVCA